MSKGNAQYIADTILLEKILTIEEGLSKQAGLVDTFRGIAEALKKQVAERVEQEGVSGALVTYLAPAVLGRIWPPLGIIATLASMWGFSIGGLMNNVLASLRPKLESGEQVSLKEINDAGRAAAQAEIGSPMEAEAKNDLFYYLRKVEGEGNLLRLVRTAQYYGGGSNLSRVFKASPWLKGSGGVLGRIFGSVGQLKGKWLIAGIIIWFIKTVLVGAGLVEGTKAVSKAVGIGEESKEEEKPGAGFSGREQTGDEEEAIQPVISLPPVIPHNLKPSGQGLQYHINDGTSIWVVPLVDKNILKTLILWAITIYPELKGYENELRSSGSLINLASTLSKGVSPESPNYLMMPKGIHTRKEVVDRFAGSIKLDKEQNES